MKTFESLDHVSSSPGDAQEDSVLGFGGGVPHRHGESQVGGEGEATTPSVTTLRPPEHQPPQPQDDVDIMEAELPLNDNGEDSSSSMPTRNRSRSVASSTRSPSGEESSSNAENYYYEDDHSADEYIVRLKSPAVVPESGHDIGDDLSEGSWDPIGDSEHQNTTSGSSTPQEDRRKAMEESINCLYQSVAAMSSRFLNEDLDSSAQKLIWHSMIHDLEHKMEKLDVDGAFESPDQKSQARPPWYSPPTQRKRWDNQENTIVPHVNWGDLFFDLFYVAAAYNLGTMLITAINPNDWLRGICYFVGIFGSLFVTWETEVYYASRYTVVDYSHRLFEVIRFIFVSNAVINIQSVSELSDPFTQPTTLLLTISILLESLMHLGLNVELYYKAQGDRKAIKMHTWRKIRNQLFPTSVIYAVAVISAIVLFATDFDESSVLPKNENMLLALGDVPLCTLTFGYLYNVISTTKRKVKAKSGGHGDVRNAYVPNVVDYVIQRYNDWTMLLLGEVVMALVETTESRRNYLVVSLGAMTLIILHALNSESAPSKSSGHALWRNTRNGTCFGLLMQLMSIGLIILGVAYKIFVADDSYGINDQISVALYAGSLTVVLACLELMLVTHRGLSKSLHRVVKRIEVDTDVYMLDINWGLSAILVFKASLFSLLISFPTWNFDINKTLWTGFGVIVSLALTRVLGWGFVFREQEIKDFVHQLSSRVSSFRASSFGGNLRDDKDSLGPIAGSLGRSIHTPASSSEESKRISRRGYRRQGSNNSLKSLGSKGSGSGLPPRVAKSDSILDDRLHNNIRRMEHSLRSSLRALYGKLHTKDTEDIDLKFDDIERPTLERAASSVSLKSVGSSGGDSIGMAIDDDGDAAVDTVLQQRIRQVVNVHHHECVYVSSLSSGDLVGVNKRLVKEFAYSSKRELVHNGRNILDLLSISDPRNRLYFEESVQNFRATTETNSNATCIIGHDRLLYARRSDDSEFRCLIGLHRIDGTDLVAGFIRNLDDLV